MYSCQECDGEDTLRMVLCDVCSRWSHFECAGVDAWIEKVPWACRFCREEALKKREVEVVEKEKLLEKKLNEVEKKEKEVEDLINEAKEFIQSEFEAKQKEMETIQANLDKKKSDLERKEQELIDREKEFLEMKQQFLEMKQEGNEKEMDGVVEEGAAGESNSLSEFSKIKEAEFLNWDQSFNLGNMMEFYIKINLHEEKDFLKECILRTFEEPFIYKIKFESGSPYHNSRILRVLIATLQKKFKAENYDDKQAKKRIISAFTQFRNTNNKRNK